MGFKGLKKTLHNDPLLKKIGQSRHDDWIEHVNLEVEAPAHIKAIKRNPLDKGDSCDEPGLFPVHISAVAHSERVIYRDMKTVDICAN